MRSKINTLPTFLLETQIPLHLLPIILRPFAQTLPHLPHLRPNPASPQYLFHFPHGILAILDLRPIFLTRHGQVSLPAYPIGFVREESSNHLRRHPRRRRFDVKPHLYLGADLVHVLTTRAGCAHEGYLELILRYGDAIGDDPRGRRRRRLGGGGGGGGGGCRRGEAAGGKSADVVFRAVVVVARYSITHPRPGMNVR